MPTSPIYAKVLSCITRKLAALIFSNHCTISLNVYNDDKIEHRSCYWCDWLSRQGFCRRAITSAERLFHHEDSPSYSQHQRSRYSSTLQETHRYLSVLRRTSNRLDGQTEVERVDRLAKVFAAKMPELEFSPAEILSFILEYRLSPEEVVDNVEAWATRIREEGEE